MFAKTQNSINSHIYSTVQIASINESTGLKSQSVGCLDNGDADDGGPRGVGRDHEDYPDRVIIKGPMGPTLFLAMGMPNGFPKTIISSFHPRH